ncbi:hypothetical protein [Piscirickettsia salmonis]|uniref:hypothetical protein n=1 Tax=Piscirickettsia salmonis TaxID=1238 RepID=UPI0012B9260F|nr:hypothetical protein [Piscirickettsia salmonis]
MLGDFASLDVQNTYRGSDAYDATTMALLRKIIVNFRKVIFLCSLLRIKQLIQIIYQ